MTQVAETNSHVKKATTPVISIKEKARETRLRYLGHIKRRKGEESMKKVMVTEVKWKRNVGRPRLRWRDVKGREGEEIEDKT